MPDTIYIILSAFGMAAVCWYAYRWCHSDGKNDGFADGQAAQSGKVVEPNGGGGSTPVIR